VRLGGDHERPQVEAVAAALRHPVAVDARQRGHGGEEVLLRQFRHGHPAGRPREPAGVVAGAEEHVPPGRPPERLQPFEDRLSVVERHGGRVQGERGERSGAGVVPAPVTGPPRGHHVLGVQRAEAGHAQQLFALSGGHGRGLFRREFQGGHRRSFTTS
jgi:hypothetical protein